MINATNQPQSISDFRDGKDQPINLSTLQLSPAHHAGSSIADGALASGGQLTLGAWSAAVFVKPQAGAQGAGLPVSKKIDLSTVPPFGDTDVFVRGFLNEWDPVNKMILRWQLYLRVHHRSDDRSAWHHPGEDCR